MEKIGMEKLLTLYCIGKESFDYFKRFYPKNEIIQVDADENLNKWCEYKACQSKDEDGKRVWANVTSYKIFCMNEELKKGNNILFVDGDIVFEKNPMSLISERLLQDSSLEFIVQNDATEDKYDYMCTGFMWLRSNENMIDITNFQRVREQIGSFQNDQQFMRKQAKRMKYAYFKLEDVPNGKYWRDYQPKNPYIIHFNYDVSEFKIRRMKMYQKWFFESKPEEKKVFEPLKTDNTLTELDVFLKQKNVCLKQGTFSKIPDQMNYFMNELKNYVDVANMQKVVEIGFLAGHITNALLSLNPKVKVVSFDLAHFQSISSGKEYIDKKHPGRHHLIKGDSKKTIPDFNTSNVDLIIIDGGMDIATIESDLKLCKKFANDDTIIYMNNVVKNPELEKYWSRSFGIVWQNAIENNLVEQLSQKDTGIGVGGAFGRYVAR
jgi:predicted O-methyltransferase YrrM